MTILLQGPQGHKYRRPRFSVSSYDFPRGPHPTPQHPQGWDTTASYRTSDDQPSGSTDPGAPKAGHAAPTPSPPQSDQPTQGCVTVCRAQGSTTTTLATWRTLRSHRASHTPHNSATTRSLLHESRHNRLPHTHSPHPQTSTPTTYPRRASGTLTICTDLRAGPGATGAGQATGAPRPRPRRRYSETTGHRHPMAHIAHYP